MTSRSSMDLEYEWREVANAMPQLVWIADSLGRVYYYNDRVSEFAGAVYEYGYWRWDGLLHDDDAQPTSDAWEKAVRDGTIYEISHRVKRADGSYRWYLSRAVPKRDETGNIIRWYGTATDIHQQKVFEETFREIEERLNSIVSQTSVGIAQCDLNGFFVMVNDRYCKLTGRTEEELRNLTVYDITHPADLKKNLTLLQKAFAEGSSIHLDKRYVRPDNSHVWVHIHVNVIRDKAGHPQYLLGVCHDISEQINVQEALKESEERFRIMADAAPNMVWSLNPDGSVKYINIFTRNFFGLKESEWPEKFSGFIHPDDLAAITKQLLHSIGSRDIFKYEARFLHHSGEYRYMHVQGAPSYFPDGRMYGYVGTAIDIDDRKRFEQKLAYQHKVTQTITDNSTDSLFLIEGKGYCTFINPAAEKLFGYSLDELKGKTLHDFIHHTHPDGSDFRLEDCPIGDAIFKGRELKDHEDVFITKNGDFISVKCSAKRVGIFDDRLLVLLQVRDITEEKRAGEALRESEERFRSMADNISAFAWMADGSGKIFWFNKRWTEYTGLDTAAMNTPLGEVVVHPDFAERVREKFHGSIMAGTPWEDTFPLRSKSGHFRWFLSRATPIKDAHGKVIRWFGTNTDITERKETEEAIKMMANNLERLVIERTIALQRSNEDLQQFAHVASHDLKEPLRKIKTFSSRLKDECGADIGENGRLYLDKISKATERMYKMVDGVLNYSTINAASQRPAPVDLNEVLANIESDLEVLIQEKNATIQYGNLPVISGAGVLIYQLFYNLINNSLKFSNNDVPPVITVHADRQTRGRLQIVVQDNGIGFEQEYAEKIFHTFTRLNSKDKYEGTGLGLALCKKIVELHNGSISALGIKGRGATFLIDFPESPGEQVSV